MKSFKFSAVAVIAGLAMSCLSGKALVLDFASLPGASINFNGDGTFNFAANNSGNQFDVTSVGASEGLDGYFSPASVFTIQSVVSPFTGLQTATISGAGTMYISDGTQLLMAAVQWSDAATFATSGSLNFNGAINLTSIVYTGSNSDLAALASAGSASEVVSFQFSSPMSLSQLQTIPIGTSFSGSISAAPVPEPNTWTFIATGLAGLFWLGVSRRRK